jgi:hypothetical protein
MVAKLVISAAASARAADILWYNTTTGQVVIWLLNGTSVIGGGSPGSEASPWQIQGMNSD